MKWQCWQTNRAEFIERYNGVVWLGLRIIILTAGALSLLGVLVSFWLALTASFVAFLLLLVGLAVAVGSFHLYVRYLEDHPDYGLSNKLITENVLNGFDFEALSVLRPLIAQNKPDVFYHELFSHPQSGIVLYRLGLSQAVIDQIMASSANFNFKAEDLITAVTRQPSNTSAAPDLTSLYDILGYVLLKTPVTEYLRSTKLEPEAIEALLEHYVASHRARGAMLESNRLHPTRTGGFAKEWAVSYTNLLDSLTHEISRDVAAIEWISPIYSRITVIDRAVTELAKKNGRNILLVGEAGIGKKELFYHLAARIVSYRTKTEIDGMTVRVLDVQQLLSSAGKVERLQQLLDALFAEIIRAGNVVLFVDQIDALLNPSNELGTANLGTILQHYLDDKKVHLIGTIDPTHYIELIKSNSLLQSRFSAIEVPPPSPTDLANILLDALPSIEHRYKCFFLYSAVNQLVSLASRYLKDQSSPQRELDLAEEVAVFAQSQNQTIIAPENVVAVVERKAEVPIQVDATARETLLNLEEKLHTRVVGQQPAIKKISDALLRARAGLSTGAKPIGSFLFLGPTGVGKTETAKALADLYFGNQRKLIRLDMTEFADANGLVKLLGQDQTTDPGALTVAIQDQPSAVVLFDEVEKASDQVRNVLLQLLDEGRLTTNYGKVLDFTNTIVIATSNAGSDFIQAQLSKDQAVTAFEKQLIDHLIAQRIFLPEFLNRFDGVVVYTALNPAEMKAVVRLQIQLLQGLMKKEKGLDLSVSEAVINDLATRGYDPVFGARALQRVIKNDLETAIARQIVETNPPPGTPVIVEKL